MPSRPRTVVGVAAAMLAVASLVSGGSGVGAAGPAANPERVLSHLLCYLGTFRPAFATVPGVGLEDQYGSTTVNVLKANIWCNPARKRRGGEVTRIVDSDQRMKQYPVQAPVTGQTLDLLVTNQFGTDQPISINVPPSALLVPTRRPPHARARGLDHFECHNVYASEVLDERVRVRDEFRRYRVRLSQQWLQCMPTEKTHGSGAPTEIRHPTATLACYLLDSQGSGPQPTFKTITQFEPRSVGATVDPGRTFQLCVPSTVETAP